jgi:modification methylase
MPEHPDLLAGLPTSVWLTGQRPAHLQRRGRYLPASTQHPAKMLPDIAAHAISVYTTPGQLVLDPMCGIGTTCVEAIHLGRDAVGVEIEPRWAGVAAANLTLARSQGATGAGMIVHGDATALPELVPAALHGQVSLVVTSPPYGPSVHGLVRPTPSGIVKTANRYSDTTRDRHNLAHAGWNGLHDGLTRILAGCRQLLRPGGTVAVTARPVRRHGTLIDLPTAVVTAGIAAGLAPVERCVALLSAIRDGRLVARPSFFQLQQLRKARAAGIPLHLIAHEDVLILRDLPRSLSSNESKRPHDEPKWLHGQSSHVGTLVRGEAEGRVQ